MIAKQKLGSPAFIIAVLLLVVNDWYFKQAFANEITGKLSDFAGLFAFPFLLSALYPRKVIAVYFFTLIAFMVWKSPFAQPFIDGLNHLGLPVGRVVDFSDYVALLILPVSYCVFDREVTVSLKPILLNVIIAFSLLAFVATSRVPGNDTWLTYDNKTYAFNFSKRELVARVNMIQMELVRSVNNYGYGKADFDSKTNVFYYNEKKDTLAELLDYEKVKATDTVFLHTSYARVNISGDEKSSSIKLIALREYVHKYGTADYKAKALKFFERSVIGKINKM